MKDIDFNQNVLSPGNLVIERRAYQENSTPEEITLLENRISFLEENIIYYDEIPILCPFSINILFDKVEDLAKEVRINNARCGLIVDVVDVVHPDAPTRQAINQRFTRICDTVSHVAFVTGKSALLNTAIRFVLFGTNLNSYSVDTNVADALNNTKKNL